MRLDSIHGTIGCQGKLTGEIFFVGVPKCSVLNELKLPCMCVHGVEMLFWRFQI